jgi:hypothetical protein
MKPDPRLLLFFSAAFEMQNKMQVGLIFSFE